MPYHRSEEHTSELQSHDNLVCRLLLEKKKPLIASGAGEAVVVIDTSGRPPATRAAGSDRPRAAGGRDALVGAGRRVFFFNDTATTEIYPLSLHDALPI